MAPNVLSFSVLYIGDTLFPGAEILVKCTTLFGKDGSKRKIRPMLTHLEDTSVSGILGGLGLDDIGPAVCVEQYFTL